MYVGDRLHKFAWNRLHNKRTKLRHVGGRTGKFYTIHRRKLK